MNRVNNPAIHILLLINLVLMTGLAQAIPDSGQAESAEVIASLAARTFCQQRGGTVTETGNQNVYVCCYRQQQKCIVSNTRLKQSALVDFPWNEHSIQDRRDVAGQ